MTQWQIDDLTDTRLGEAWPLLRLRYPHLTLDRWLAEARSLRDDESAGGVLVAETGRGYIYAVSAYMVDRWERARAEMVLPFVAYVQWNGASDPLGRLLETVEGFAREHGCGAVGLDGRPIAADSDTARWERLGYRWVDERLMKLIPNPAANSNPNLRSATWP